MLNSTPAPIPEASTPLPSGRSRRGKIARLPLALREQLNRRLQEGELGGPLLAWLNGLPDVQAVLAARFSGRPILQQNLSAWKLGGYREWEEERSALQAAAPALAEAARGGLGPRQILVLLAKLALGLQRLESQPNGVKKVKCLRALAADAVQLQSLAAADQQGQAPAEFPLAEVAAETKSEPIRLDPAQTRLNKVKKHAEAPGKSPATQNQLGGGLRYLPETGELLICAGFLGRPTDAIIPWLELKLAGWLSKPIQSNPVQTRLNKVAQRAIYPGANQLLVGSPRRAVPTSD